MRNFDSLIIASSFVVIFATSIAAQSAAPAGLLPATTAQPDLPPATKLEGFKPEAGSIVTFGYDELGKVSYVVSVDVREMRDTKGTSVRGLIVEIIESQYRTERSFVDADEIPELLKGLDALLEVKANPTQFKNFEVRYATRGELQLTTFNDSKGKLQYAIRVGRLLGARRAGLDAADMLKLRGLFEAALQKLNTTSGK